jgi:hypothetical protein
MRCRACLAPVTPLTRERTDVHGCVVASWVYLTCTCCNYAEIVRPLKTMDCEGSVRHAETAVRGTGGPSEDHLE